MLLTDYEVTDKGQDWIDSPTLTDSQRRSLDYSVLFAILNGGIEYQAYEGWAKPFQHPDMDGAVSRLLKRGYVIDTSKVSTTTYLSRIPEGTGMRKVYDTYYKVANELPVSDEELDSVLEYISSRFNRRPKGSPVPVVEDVLRGIQGARSRADKVIVLDKAIGVVHFSGPWILDPELLPLGELDTREYKRKVKILEASQKVLGRLAGY